MIKFTGSHRDAQSDLCGEPHNDGRRHCTHATTVCGGGSETPGWLGMRDSAVAVAAAFVCCVVCVCVCVCVRVCVCVYVCYCVVYWCRQSF